MIVEISPKNNMLRGIRYGLTNTGKIY